MEDHKQSRTQPDANKEEKILDLTKDMELADQEKHKIFDLSEGMDQPEVVQKEEPPSSPSPSSTDTSAKEGTPSVSDTPAEVTPPAIEQDEPSQSDTTPHIEDPTLEDLDNIIADEFPETEPSPPEETVEAQDTISNDGTGDQADEPELTLDDTVSMPDAPEPVDEGEEKHTIENEVDAAFDEDNQ